MIIAALYVVVLIGAAALLGILWVAVKGLIHLWNLATKQAKKTAEVR